MAKRSLESPAGPSTPLKKPKTILNRVTGVASSVKSFLFRGSEEGSLLDDVARADQERSQPFRALRPGDVGYSSHQPIDLTLDTPRKHSPPPPSRFLAPNLIEDCPPPSRALASYPSPRPLILFEPGSLAASSQEPLSPTPSTSRVQDLRPQVRDYSPAPRRRKWTNSDSVDSDHSSSCTSSPSRRRKLQRSNLRRGERNISQEFVTMSRATNVPETKISSGLQSIPRGQSNSGRHQWGPRGVSGVGLRLQHQQESIMSRFMGRDDYKQLIASTEPTELKPLSYSETLRDPSRSRQSMSQSASSSQTFVSSRRAIAKEAARHPRPDVADLLRQTKLEDERIEKTLKSRRTWIPEELPKEKEKYVRSALQNPSFSAKCLREEVKAPDLRRLKPGQWLNDEVINFYGAMLQKRADESLDGKGPKRKVHYFSSFFYKKLSEEGYEKGRLKRWAKKMDLFEKDIILFPININNVHWTCGAINLKDKRFEYYDSMGSRRKDVYKNMRSYLQAEHQEKKGSKLDLTGWTDYWNEDSPQQDNAFDCGVFSCITLEALARGREPTESEFEFGQDHMDVLRKLMIWEIGHSELVPRA